MDDKQWLSDYFELYRESLFGVDVRPQLVELTGILKETHARGKKTIIAGNGGSASISSHCAVDITKNAGVRCVNFNEADLITCFANDYGYELWLEKAMEFYADEGDVAVLISSSGKSPNMVRAGQFAIDNGMKLITFTGMAQDNPLSQLGHINLWVDSRAYNVIEMTHHIWLLAVCDLIIGNAEYAAS
jgi:D-sedoheptulose 7-phosphate isomerase